MNNKEDIFYDEWDDAMLDEVFKVEETTLSSITKPPSNSSFSSFFPQQSHPPTSVSVPFFHASSFSPPRELSQRSTAETPYSPSNKDLEIERLKRELGRASKEIANLEKECLKLRKERDKKEDHAKFISSRNEEDNACTKCSKSINKDFGTLAPDNHKISSKFQNGVSSNNPTVETTFKAKGVETNMVNHQDYLSGDPAAYLDLSQKLLAIWGSPTDKKMGSNAISKLLAGCQRDFHILFGCMNMSLPSEITRELFTNLSSSGEALHYLKDCFHTPEAVKVSHLYLALTKIADGTDVLETLIDPLLDLCGTENVIIVHSSLCVLHMLLKLLMELEKNFGRRDNVFIEGVCVEKDLVDSDGLEGVKDGKLFNEGILSRKECWNHQISLQTRVNWIGLFEIMHQIATRIIEESVRVETVSIMKLLLLRCNAYFEREQFSKKTVFKTICELLKKDAGLPVKKHALRLLYLVLNCPKLLVTFCCGCKEGDDSSAMNDNESASDFQNFKVILEGLADCVASHRGGLLLNHCYQPHTAMGYLVHFSPMWKCSTKYLKQLISHTPTAINYHLIYCCLWKDVAKELKVSRSAILVLAFLASSGQQGFEILVGHRLSSSGVNYLMLILQLLVSEMDLEAGANEELPEIFRERTFLIREILILLNRLVSSPSYSATVLRSLTNTRDMAGLTIDVASRLSRKGKKNEEQDNMAKHIREIEIVDLALLFKKRVFTYLGDGLS
ncbi:uncharacterized protein LOC113870469 [Abrus precatorius]|uniref:Uncharacterized protein LOC113870469 n=2 Tax=Abrus precatorius TaxID=3816 RepID=A0A8B8M2V9_ABRPR|nr:uncharacterized protein LOC113870469 [Abrus precatorius]